MKSEAIKAHVSDPSLRVIPKAIGTPVMVMSLDHLNCTVHTEDRRACRGNISALPRLV